MVLPATGSRATSDPLVFLAGGGVAPATRYAAFLGNAFPHLREQHDIDHLTPPRYGQHVAQSLPRARHLVLPRRGHNDVDECITGMIEAFIATADASKVDASCLAKTEELSFTLKRSE